MCFRFAENVFWEQIDEKRIVVIFVALIMAKFVVVYLISYLAFYKNFDYRTFYITNFHQHSYLEYNKGCRYYPRNIFCFVLSIYRIHAYVLLMTSYTKKNLVSNIIFQVFPRVVGLSNTKNISYLRLMEIYVLKI